MKAFQSAHAPDAPAGFRAGTTLRHAAAPWLPGPSYLDWYVVDGFAELGTLNEAAVTASRKAPHDAVAALAAGGMGGVYGHKAGSESLRDARFAHWFGKPDGMRYDQLFARDFKGSLWMRQMVLGPSPEFVLFTASETTLPVPARTYAVERVY